MATITVNTMFSDNMVLQRNKPVPVWGTGTPSNHGQRNKQLLKTRLLSLVSISPNEHQVFFGVYQHRIWVQGRVLHLDNL